MEVTAGSLVWRLMLKWRAAVERTVAPLGLTHAQYTLLASLRGLSRTGARPSQRELADYTGLEQVYVSKLVRALERAGFVNRSTHPADPRAVALRLTERGVKVIDRAVTLVHELQEVLAEPLGGTAGRRYTELVDMLRTLLGEPRPTGGERSMTQATALFGQDLGVAHRAGNQVLMALLDREGHTFEGWVTLKVLYDEGAPVARFALRARLGGAVGAEEPAITGLLARLESDGLIRERAGALELTADGAALFDRLFGEVRALSAELLDGLPAGDVDATRRTLATYTSRANDLVARIRT